MNDPIRSYRDLVVWQAAVDLATRCYALTSDFPKSEAFGLTSQIRRASTSVAANIAEGHGRESTAQFQQFLRIAQGSLKELETHIIIATRVGFLTPEDEQELLNACSEIGRMVRSLNRSLAAR